MLKTTGLCFLLLCLCGFVVCVQAATDENITGRFIHITLPGANNTLSLAEVEVFSGGKNVALKKKTKQTSTAHGGDASRAVDGNTNGDWGKGSITHTPEGGKNPAWEVNLGKNFPIEKIVVWNRNGYESRLYGCRVLILNNRRKVVWGRDIPELGRGATELLINGKTKFSLIGKKLAKLSQKKSKPRRSPVSSFKNTGTPESLRRSVNDLIDSYGVRYPKGREFLTRLDQLEPQVKEGKSLEQFEELKKEAMLANPLLDFDKLLLIRRKGNIGLPANWQGNSSLGKTGYDNDLAVMSPLMDGEIKTLHRPSGGQFVGDFDLHFDADRILFSSVVENGPWAIFEIKPDGTGLRRVSPDMGKDIDSYDAVYLPNGKIIFDSSTTYTGVPCVGGNDFVSNLHIMNSDGTGVRRLCFEQDHDWCPVVMNNGRILYLRWEYTDSAHYFSRVLMHMNPDGTDQKGFYGSNSYWPNSLFYARPVPGDDTKFIGIVTGHHGVRREGALVLFDVTLGKFEADGAVQLIPGYGKKVEALTVDRLASMYDPHFLHPYPLSDKYFLVSCNIGGWGIYLVDVFDNMLLLKKETGVSLLEPVPFRTTKTPPVIPDHIDLDSKESTIIITDIYQGPGLKGVPKGTVKKLRLYKYEYGPRKKGGHYATGMEAGWDIHLILGTVPVDPDGSASFIVPANTPISIQPLDKAGKALQLMRSWFVAMPGETLSCVGCHESQNSTPTIASSSASVREPSEIKPWYGPVRGFSFAREVQPVLDKFCVGCHDGSSRKNGKKMLDFQTPSNAHYVLHPYVRRNGPEGDYHLLTPLEFHVDTSELVQMFQKGHHNVKLDTEAWDRLYTWIDLNAPWHGTWTEAGANKQTLARRLELRKIYASIETNPELIVNPYIKENTFIKPDEQQRDVRDVKLALWPFSEVSAKKMQGKRSTLELDSGDGLAINLVRIPKGEFPMGSNDETPVEQPVTKVKINRSFWMGATEVSLEQYRKFDPEYMNGVYDMHYKDQVKRGYYMNEPRFPVIRVSWQKAMEYCKWLSKKTGRNVTLPTEAQWEWACRAGTSTSLSFGDFNTDFSSFANMADVTVKEMAVRGVNPKPIKNPNASVDFELKDARFNDKVLHLADVGSYQPNQWGLYDMHGNVAEWTRSKYKPYPYSNTDGRNNDTADNTKRIIRGGSWHDRQHRSTSSFRLAYPDWQRVYHVGFRVVVE